MRRALAILMVFVPALLCFIVSLAFGVCAGIGFMVLRWGPEAIAGPPPGFLTFLGFSVIAMAGTLMGVISTYVLVILPVAIRSGRWLLAGCNGRRIAWYADGLAGLMVACRSEQAQQRVPGSSP